MTQKGVEVGNKPAHWDPLVWQKFLANVTNTGTEYSGH